MGWLSDLGHYVNPFDKSNVITGKGGIIDEGLRGFDDKVLGGDAADAAREAAAVQATAGQQASALLDPFAAIGESGLSQSGFLTDPNQQFSFLQNNPLFQLSLDNLNQQTRLSGRGRAGATDASQQFANNTLLAAQPLISGQKQSIGDLLNFGLTTASNQGNLLTGAAAAEAGGIVGAANAEQAGLGNLLQLIGSLPSTLSGGAP